MNTLLKHLAIIFLLLPFIIPSTLSAHQPRVVTGEGAVMIVSPEISKAYYGKLDGEPVRFNMSASSTFPFYMNILVPDLAGAKKDVSATLYAVLKPNTPIGAVGGIKDTWKPFHEEFAGDDYFMASEYRSELPAGEYFIIVESSDNDSRYSLSIGELESFPLSEILNAYVAIPKIKSFFFEKPALSAFATPFLGGPLVVILIICGAGALLWKRYKKTRRNKVH
jgi:hypothetical protein